MSNPLQLRVVAREILDETLQAVDPAAALRDAVGLDQSRLNVRETSFELRPGSYIFSVAIGKAAVPMASALEQALRDQFAQGVIVAPAVDTGARNLGGGWECFAGGHPLPSEASMAAGEAALSLLERANEQRALILFLISGGGSAMIEWPISRDITLSDLRAANRILIECGASIGEINSVRRAFSAVKGGRLATHASNCPQVTLIVSDVPAGEEYNVASGPTLTPPTDAPSAGEVVARYGLHNQLPSSIMRAIDKPTSETPQPNRHEHFVLLDNDTALQAAASAALTRGFAAEIARDISDEPIDVGCEKLLTRFADMQDSVGRTSGKDVCLISGGEFACPVRGDGIGGRNLETALRLAIVAEEDRERPGDFVALCAGTDGIDGNSPAAGAIIDSTTMERAREIGLDPYDFLNRSDAYSFFVALGDTITTGATGTNVRDLRILLTADRKSHKDA